jgi:uncharacterized membrane protein YecN with MAPEG domain
VGEHKDLSRAHRAHGNALEHLAIVAPLLIALEAMGAPRWEVTALGAAFLAARLSHAGGMLSGVFPFHFWGALVTYVVEVALAIAAFIKAVELLA